MEFYTSVVVDDYQPSVSHLMQAIERSYPQIDVIGKYPVSPESLKKIDETSPDLVFFDIGGKNHSGIEILSNWHTPNSFQFILTNIHNIPDDINFSFPITDCIPKPICSKRLVKAIDRAMDRLSLISLKKELTYISNELKGYMQPKISIPTMKGFDMVDHRNIIYAEAADNYSILHLVGGNQILCSQSLAKLESRVRYMPFLRVHRKSLINLNHICSYMKGDGGQVIMSNKVSLNVSRNKKDELIRRLSR